MSAEKKKLIYTFPLRISFVRNDIALLGKEYRVHEYEFNPRKKIFTWFWFIRQFFYLLWHAPRASVLVSQFAGYHSYLPGLFAKILRKPHLLVLGGTDCVSFPSINYGNFRKPVLGWFTRKSLKMAAHLAPCHESLVSCSYTYQDDDGPRQGYLRFCPEVKTPFTVIAYGYNPEMFRPTQPKTPRSFLTVAQMNSANYYRKGIDLIFEMAKRFPDCRFTVVGHKPEMAYPFLPENVELVTFVPYEGLVDFYSRHQFYFQVSICEGFPSAICEAMLCECIPIGSDVAAIPTIIGDAGFVLRRRNADELEALVRQALAADHELMGAKARKQIMDNFPPSTRQKLLELVNELVKKG